MMRLLLVLLLLPALATAQSISGVAGNIADGSTIVVSGSSFGTRPTQAPWKWDNAEGQAHGAAVTGTWSLNNGGNTANGVVPVYSTDNLRTGSTAAIEIEFPQDGTYTRSFGASDFSNTLDAVYVDVWFYVEQLSPEVGQHKMIRITNTGGGGYPNMYPVYTCYTTPHFTYEGSWSGGSYSDDHAYIPTSASNLWGRWVHLQYYSELATADTQDGVIKAWLDGALVTNRSDIASLDAAYSANSYNQIWFGFYISRSTYSGCSTPGSGTFRVYYDDVYVDNRSRARVEIGNNSTYNACTHREIQPMTAWAATEITVTGNTGSFADQAAVYLFVIDGSGNISSGYGPLTVSSDAGDTEAPAAPTGLAAVAGSGQVSLSWAANTEGDLAGYYVYRSTTSGSGYAQVSSLVVGTSFVNSGLSSGTTYYYVLRAADTSGNRSANSAEVSGTPTGGAPAGLKYPENLNAAAIGE